MSSVKKSYKVWLKPEEMKRLRNKATSKGYDNTSQLLSTLANQDFIIMDNDLMKELRGRI